MTVEFQISKKDYLLSNKQLFFKSIKKIIIFILIITFILKLATFNSQIDWKSELISLSRFLIISSLVYVILFFLYFQYHNFKLLKHLVLYPDLLSRKIITFENDEIEIKTDKNEKKLSWYAISHFYSLKDFIVLTLFNGNSIVIPKNCLVDSFEISKLIGIIDTNLNIVRQKKGINKKMFFDKRSKNVFIIGGLIILITYLGVWINQKPEKIFKKTNIIRVQNNLNQIVKEIEYYKLKMGVYPDSLTQHDFKYSTNLAFRDIAPINKKILQLYQYRKIDQFYTLYSVGPDGIDKTNDDIFPIVKIDSISSIGWCKPY
ncbi:MAG: putative transrane protein [Bacteroidetes bacterium]|nr:putative transrane protein [Bacteroidota bacterium]